MSQNLSGNKPNVVSIVSRHVLPDTAGVLSQIMPGLKQLPLGIDYVEMIIENVSTSIVNALRRTILDEIPGSRLSIGDGGFQIESNDPFMVREFVEPNIQGIRLRPDISDNDKKNIRLSLRVVNDTTTVMSVFSGDMVVTAGNITVPIFNPTFGIADIQPGKMLIIDNIRIEEGYGYQNALFSKVCCGGIFPLDVEMFSDNQIRFQNINNEANDSETESKAEVNEDSGMPKNINLPDFSGFKISSLIANPQKFRLTYKVPAVLSDSTASIDILIEACINIKDRLRHIQGLLDNDSDFVNPHFIISETSKGSVGILRVHGETHTIGKMLTRSIYDLYPDIDYVGYVIQDHKNVMEVTINHTSSEDIFATLSKALRNCISIFDRIQLGIKNKM